MSLSANFPHQLALLVIALQTDKLPICKELSDPTEKSLVASLMTYMNNRDFRTPITIARKTLGEQIRVKRSTLFNKLRSLKEKGLIEDVTGEKPIKFTEKAIALMQLEWTKQADRWKEKKKEKQKSFKVGRSSFPIDLVKLINRGVSENQLRGLLSEAKKVGRKVQDVLQKFEHVLEKYEGKILFLVIRSILRNPDKYVKYGKPAPAPAGALSVEDHQLLEVARDNAKCILQAGEQLQLVDNVLAFSNAASAGAPLPVTQEVITMLKDRMRERVIEHVKSAPDWTFMRNKALNATATVDLAKCNDHYCALQVLHHKSGKTECLQAQWHSVYSAIPYAARVVEQAGHEQKDRRIGRQLMHRGLTYLVDAIDNMTAVLRVQTGKSAGRYCTMPVENLNDPEVQWLRA